MIKPTIPGNESERLDALNKYSVLDTLPEKEYDAITRIAAEICGTPIALVSLIDPERQWFKSRFGLDAPETPRDLAFCAHAINEPDELFIVPDASKDERFHDNPLSAGAPHVVFYAGAPLVTPEGFAVGTLCVIDHKPGSITEGQKETLKALADQVISQMELRKKNHELLIQKRELERLNEQLNAFAYRLSHDLKTPLRGVQSVTEWLRDEYESLFDEQASEWMDLIFSRIEYMEALIDGMLNYSKASTTDLVFKSFNFENMLTEMVEQTGNTSNCTLSFTDCDREINHSEFVLRMVFQNLISNSIKYGNKEDCQISVSFHELENGFEFIYEDNGPGIPEAYRKKVFELFETLGEKNAESTGIGLATVASILQRFEGNISLKDRDNGLEGVCFVLTFPRKK